MRGRGLSSSSSSSRLALGRLPSGRSRSSHPLRPPPANAKSGPGKPEPSQTASSPGSLASHPTFPPVFLGLFRFSTAMPSVAQRTYKSRAASHPVAVARELLACIDRKSTNLCVSVDVPTKQSLLRIVDAAGPYCCCVKVHSPHSRYSRARSFGGDAFFFLAGSLTSSPLIADAH